MEQLESEVTRYRQKAEDADYLKKRVQVLLLPSHPPTITPITLPLSHYHTITSHYHILPLHILPLSHPPTHTLLTITSPTITPHHTSHSHPHTITSSHYHPPTITPSHYHTLTITPSHYHTHTLSHPHYHTLTLSHSLTLTFCDRHHTLSHTLHEVTGWR